MANGVHANGNAIPAEHQRLSSLVASTGTYSKKDKQNPYAMQETPGRSEVNEIPS
jgi:hypothetical protein